MEVLESVLGYSFRERKLLTMALTHGSVGYEAQRNLEDNQRLEFLGDAVLQLLMSELLFQRLPEADEGMLTKLRSQVVSTKALASLARKLNVGAFLIMGRGEEANGGRNRENSLADAVEAILGAIYLDGGLGAAQSFAKRMFDRELERLLTSPTEPNPKGQLQEIIQSVGPTPPHYKILSQSGPDHAKQFEASVIWLGTALGTGSGSSKKEAETASARNALQVPDLMERLKALAFLNISAAKITGNKCEQKANNCDQSCEQDS